MVLRAFLSLLCCILFFAASMAQKGDEIPKFQQHVVRDRETASSIAADFNIKLKYFLMLNNFPDSVKLKPGQKVLIRQLKDGEIAEKDGVYTASKPAEVSRSGEKTEAKKTKTSKKETETASTSKGSSIDMLTGPNGAKYEMSSGEFHVVQKGQTFYHIALMYHISMDKLKALNNMTTTDIKVGQELKVSK